MEKETAKTMKAIVLAKDLSIKLQDVPIPKPRDGEVLVKVIAAPINPSDLAFLKGAYSSEKPSPSVPGLQGSGIVVENGGGVIGWSLVNKKVAFAIPNGFTGTYGQYAIVNSQQAMPIPSELSLQLASMSFVNPLTAIVMLNKVKDAKIKTIIHTAAASSLGRMMNKLFSSEGVTIINVVRRQEQVELLKKEGAKYVLNSSTENFQQELAKLAKELNATLCYDAVAGDLTAKILKALPPNSSIEIYGAMSQERTISNLDISQLLFKNKVVKGFWLTQQLKDFGLLSKLNLIRKLGNLLKNELKSTIAKQFPLDKFEQGLEYYLSHMTEGKVLIKPWQGYQEQPALTKDEKKKKQKQEKEKEKKKQELAVKQAAQEKKKVEATKAAEKKETQVPTAKVSETQISQQTKLPVQIKQQIKAQIKQDAQVQVQPEVKVANETPSNVAQTTQVVVQIVAQTKDDVQVEEQIVTKEDICQQPLKVEETQQPKE